MSRIGKQPVPIPQGTVVTLEGQTISATGKLGTRQVLLPEEVHVIQQEQSIIVKPNSTTKRAAQMWGLSRTLVHNLIVGVSTGYTVDLEINGVGFRALAQERVLLLNLGYSHQIKFPIPDDITIKTERPTSISIFGHDKQKVGQIAAIIRSFRKPEPYKGKGIKYVKETLIRKEGKKK